MTMAGETQIHAQRADIVSSMPTLQQFQRACQPQAHLISVQGHSLDLLEELREIYGRYPNLRSDLRKRPTSCQIRCQHEFRALHQLALARRAARGALSQRTAR